jgi:serine protease Do
MKKYLIALLAILSLGQTALIPNASAQNPRVTIPDFADLVERASPAVVNIRTTEKVVVQQSQGGIPGMPEDQAEFDLATQGLNMYSALEPVSQ